jgi:hypothetical protein
MMVFAGSAVWPIVSHPPVTERPYVNLSGSNSRWILTPTAVSIHASLDDPPSPSVESLNSIRVTSDADRTVTESPANGAH